MPASSELVHARWDGSSLVRQQHFVMLLSVRVPGGCAGLAGLTGRGWQAGLSRPGRARSPVGLEMSLRKPGRRYRWSLAGRRGRAGPRLPAGGAARRGTGCRSPRKPGPAVTPAVTGRALAPWPWPAPRPASRRGPAPPAAASARVPAPAACPSRPSRVSLRVIVSPTGDRARPGRERPAGPAAPGCRPVRAAGRGRGGQAPSARQAACLLRVARRRRRPGSSPAWPRASREGCRGNGAQERNRGGEDEHGKHLIRPRADHEAGHGRPVPGPVCGTPRAVTATASHPSRRTRDMSASASGSSTIKAAMNTWTGTQPKAA